MVVLKKKEKKRETEKEKQNTPLLKQDNVLVWISCQILGRLVGS